MRYTAFLVPGLVMMSVLQNAFANSSSSLIQSKVTGSRRLRAAAADFLRRILCRLRAGALVRGLVVGVGVLLVTGWFAGLLVRQRRCGSWRSPCSAARFWASLGMIAGIWADKFDQLAAFQNFLIMPLTLLSGVFYSIHSLPPFWQQRVAFQSRFST